MIRALPFLFLVLALLCACEEKTDSQSNDAGPEAAAKPETVVSEDKIAKVELAPKAIPPATASTYFSFQVGDQTIDAQIALTEKEQQTGLMHRESMPENRGMVFVFLKPKARNFWMRNTLIPLDIAYINSNGVIQEIHPMEPLDESGVPSLSPNIQFALEMNQGWFQEHGVKTGDSLDLTQLANAIERRGVDPSLYKLPEPTAPR